MKKSLLWITLATSVAVFAAAPESSALVALQPASPQIQAAAMTADLLTRFHYTPKALDDSMSQKMFDRYLKSLDSEKLLFTQADVDRFAPARDKLDDAIKNRDLSTPYAMFNLHQNRLRERNQTIG